jgi:hypothetical protein
MKTKEEIINEILESGAVYVKTSISTQSCATSIAIRDIEDADHFNEQFGENFWWEEQSTGLDEEDYQ